MADGQNSRKSPLPNGLYMGSVRVGPKGQIVIPIRNCIRPLLERNRAVYEKVELSV